MTIDALIELHEPRGAASRLVELYGAARRARGPRRGGAALRPQRARRRALGEQQSAPVATRSRRSTRRSTRSRAIRRCCRSLERLYRAERMWDELLSEPDAPGERGRGQGHAHQAADGDRRPLRGGAAEPSDAIEQYRLVLDEDAVNDHAIQAVRAIGEGREELRLDAAEVLEPVLRAAGAPRGARRPPSSCACKRADRSRADRAPTAAPSPPWRTKGSGRPHRGGGGALRALEDTPDDASPSRGDRDGSRSATEGFGRYCDALTAAGRGDVRRRRSRRTCSCGSAASPRRSSGDDRRSVQAYAKAVEHAGDTPELLEALDRLYGRLGDRRRSRTCSSGASRSRATRSRRICCSPPRCDPDRRRSATRRRASRRCGRRLDRAPDHKAARRALEALTDTPELFDEAAEALEGVYRAQGRSRRAGAASTRSASASRARRASASGMRLDLARVLRGAVQRRQGRRRRRSRRRSPTIPPTSTCSREIERLAPGHERLAGGRATPSTQAHPRARSRLRDGARPVDADRRVAQGQDGRPRRGRARLRGGAQARSATSEVILR